jgi:hypothetical protein
VLKEILLINPIISDSFKFGPSPLFNLCWTLVRGIRAISFNAVVQSVSAVCLLIATQLSLRRATNRSAVFSIALRIRLQEVFFIFVVVLILLLVVVDVYAIAAFYCCMNNFVKIQKFWLLFQLIAFLIILVISYFLFIDW